MQIQGVSSMTAQYATSTASLTDEQKSTLEEILSEYDSENLTEEDKTAIKEAIKEAGITPSRELMTTLEDAGFDMRPSEGGTPPSTAPETEDSSSQQIKSLFEQYKSGDITEDELQTQIQTLFADSTNKTGILIDSQA